MERRDDPRFSFRGFDPPPVANMASYAICSEFDFGDS
jgi:hypothetical protein